MRMRLSVSTLFFHFLHKPYLLSKTFDYVHSISIPSLNYPVEVTCKGNKPRRMARGILCPKRFRYFYIMKIFSETAYEGKKQAKTKYNVTDRREREFHSLLHSWLSYWISSRISTSLAKNISCNWRMKNQLDATCYFIVLLISSTCFGHNYAHYQEFASMLLITTLVVSFLVCCMLEVRCS